MAFRSISVALTGDITGFRSAMGEASGVARQVAEQLAAIGSNVGLDRVTGQATEAGGAVRALGETTRVAGEQAQGAFGGLDGQLSLLGEQTARAAGEQKQFATAAEEAGRQAQGAYGAAGTAATESAALARTGFEEAAAGVSTLVGAAGEARTAVASIGGAAGEAANLTVAAWERTGAVMGGITSTSTEAAAAQQRLGEASTVGSDAALSSMLQVERALGLVGASLERLTALEAQYGEAAVLAGNTAAAAHARAAVTGGAPGGGGGLSTSGATAAQVAASTEGGFFSGFAKSTVPALAVFTVGIKAGEEFIKIGKEAFAGAQMIGVGLNQADIIFGTFAHDVIGSTDALGNKFGFSNAAMLVAADNIGKVATSMGLTQHEASQLATNFEPVIGAVARFKNTDVETVGQAFQRGLLGVSKGLKNYGVQLDATHLQQAAFELGIAGTSKQWTSAELVQVRARTIMDQLSSVTDNLSKSQNTLAGRIATARGHLENWLEAAGHAATPALLGVFDGLGTAAQRVGPLFSDLGGIVGDLGSILKSTADAVSPLVAGLGALGGGTAVFALTKLAEALRATFDWISQNQVAAELFGGVIALSVAPQILKLAGALGSLGKGALLDPVLHSLQAVSRVLGTMLAESSIGPLRSLGTMFTNFGTSAETASLEASTSWRSGVDVMKLKSEELSALLRTSLPAAAATAGSEMTASLESTLGTELTSLEARAAGLGTGMKLAGAEGAGGGLILPGGIASRAPTTPLVRGTSLARDPAILAAEADSAGLAATTVQAEKLGGALGFADFASKGLAAQLGGVALAGAGLALVVSHANEIGDAVTNAARSLPLLNQLPGVGLGTDLSATVRGLNELGRAGEESARSGMAVNVAKINTELNKVAGFDYQSVGQKFKSTFAGVLTDGAWQIPANFADRLKGVDKAFASMASHPLQLKSDLEAFANIHGFPSVDALLKLLPKTAGAMKDVSAAAKPLQDDLAKVRKDLGVPQTDAQSWIDLAAAANMPVAAFKKVADESGFTKDQLDQLRAGGIDDLTALGASVKSMQDVFSKGVSPLSLVAKFATPLDFTGLAAQQAAANAAGNAGATGADKSAAANLTAQRAVDAHTTALNNLSTAQARLDSLRANPKSNPVTIAAAEHKVEEALRRVATSADAAGLAQSKAGDASSAAAASGSKWTLTADAIRTGYRNILANVQSFNTDMATLVNRGLNPQSLVELMNMEPQTAASIAKAVLTDTGGTVIQTMNMVTAAMSNLIIQHTQFAQLAALATAPETLRDPVKGPRMAATMPQAQGVDALRMAKPGITNKELEDKLGISPAQLKTLNDDYVLGLQGIEADALSAWQKANEKDSAAWAAANADRNITSISQAHKGKADQPEFDLLEPVARKVSAFKTQFPSATAADIEKMFAIDPATLQKVSSDYSLGIDMIETAGGAALLKDQAALSEASKKAAEGVSQDFGFNLGSKGQDIVNRLSDSIAQHAPAMGLQAQLDLVSSFGQDKADAVVNDMIFKLAAAGRLIEAAQLDYEFHPQIDVMPGVVTLPDGTTHRIGAVGSGAGQRMAAGGIEDHTPTIAQGGPMRIWNEPELPWEGYVSGHPRYFRRSEQVMHEIAQRLGGQYVPKAQAKQAEGSGPHHVEGFARHHAAVEGVAMHRAAGRVDGAQHFAAGGVTFPNVSEVSGVMRDGVLRAPGAQALIDTYVGTATTQFVQDVAKMQAGAEANAAAGAASAGRGSVAAPGNVQDWIGQAQFITGSPTDWYPALAKLVMRESGGNPSAVNPTPVGREHASGLFQMLPSTFAAHALPGFGNIFAGLDNAISALRYIAGTYGSPMAIPHLYDNQYRGYAAGGLLEGPIMMLASGGVVGGGALGHIVADSAAPRAHGTRGAAVDRLGARPQMAHGLAEVAGASRAGLVHSGVLALGPRADHLDPRTSHITRERTTERDVLRHFAEGGVFDRLRVEPLNIPSYGGGGTVGGAPGETQLAFLHGGEHVITPQQVAQPIRVPGGSSGGAGTHVDHLDIHVPLHLEGAHFGGDVTEQDVHTWVERGVKKAGDRFMAGLGSR